MPSAASRAAAAVVVGISALLAPLLPLLTATHASPLPAPSAAADSESLLLQRALAASLPAYARQAAEGDSNGALESGNVSSSSSPAAPASYPLTTSVYNDTLLAFQPQGYVSNGYIGARLPAAGIGWQAFEPTFNNDTFHNGTQGWPLFSRRQTASIVAGFYAQLPNDQVPGVSQLQLLRQRTTCR